MTSIDQRRTTRFLAVLVIAALTSACAGTPTNTAVQSVPRGDTITVVGVISELETPNARTAGENIAGGAATGAAGGAVMGAGAGFMMGFACGPLFLVCSPAGLVGGAAGGAIFGAAVGGISKAMLALPKEKAEALEILMAETINDLSGSQTLVDEFKMQSDNRWSLLDAGASTEITLGIEEFSIDQGKDDTLVLKIVNSMIVTYGPGEFDTIETILYTYVSGRHHIDHWVENDGANFRAEVHAGFAANIADMINALD